MARRAVAAGERALGTCRAFGWTWVAKPGVRAISAARAAASRVRVRGVL